MQPPPCWLSLSVARFCHRPLFFIVVCVVVTSLVHVLCLNSSWRCTFDAGLAVSLILLSHWGYCSSFLCLIMAVAFSRSHDSSHFKASGREIWCSGRAIGQQHMSTSPQDASRQELVQKTCTGYVLKSAVVQIVQPAMQALRDFILLLEQAEMMQ